MAKVYNRSSEIRLRRRLRQEMPSAEVLLWCRLRGWQLDDLKFRRQFSVGPYVVDFYRPAAKLAVEVDGDSHFGDGAEVRDAKRQAYIESFGIVFVRCANGDVYENIEGVLERIHEVACGRLPGKNPPQSPLGTGGKGRKTVNGYRKDGTQDLS